MNSRFILPTHGSQILDAVPATMTTRTTHSSWLFTFLLSIQILFITGGASGEPMSLQEYQGRIQAAIEYIQSEEGALQQEESSYLKRTFPPGLEVQDGRGEKTQIDHWGFLQWADTEKDPPPSRLQLTTHLKSLQQQLSWQREGAESIRDQAWDERRRLLDEVYQNREFRNLKEKKTPPWKAYIEEFFKSIGDWLREHLGPLGPMLPGKWSQYILYGVILVLGGVLIVWILRSVGPISWRWQHPELKPSQEVKAPEKDWATWREQARSKAHQGAFREAIRSLFVSALLEGHHKGWWVYEPETTNREHLARVEGSAERRRALRHLTDLYESAWYGLGHPGLEEFHKCESWLRQMGTGPSKMGGAS